MGHRLTRREEAGCESGRRPDRLKPSAIGAWLSLARAPGSGPGGRRFESSRPDQSNQPVARYGKGPNGAMYTRMYTSPRFYRKR